MLLPEFSDLLEKKLRGERWSQRDVELLVKLVASGKLSGEQTGALLMLIFTKGMDFEETVHLTTAMTSSGETLTWSKSLKPLVVDKHSTGGVGDSVSLSLMPSLLANGVKVPMISGRSLGLTGGTIDKMESLPGFNANLSAQEMHQAVTSGAGGFLAGQTASMVPADRVLYAARSETATIRSVPLITSSILSKKAAEGVSALAMDVKFGRAAFMATYEEALELAESIEKTGRGYGMTVTAFITDMNRPLGRCVGNAVEVAEALQLLNGGNGGSAGLRELVALQGGWLLRHAGVSKSPAAGAEAIRRSWSDGSGLAALRKVLVGQGVAPAMADALCERGSFSVAEYLKRMNRMPGIVSKLTCKTDGYVSDINALSVAKFVHQITRPASADGALDYSAGLELLVARGDRVAKDQPWVTIYHGEPLTEGQKQEIEASLLVTKDPTPVEPLVRKIFPTDG